MKWKALGERYLKVHLPQSSAVHLHRLVFSKAAGLAWIECGSTGSKHPHHYHSCSGEHHPKSVVLKKEPWENKDWVLNSKKRRERTVGEKKSLFYPMRQLHVNECYKVVY